MKSIHPTFQQVTRHGTLFGEAVKGGPRPGGKKASKPKPKKGKKQMKKKAEPGKLKVSGDADDADAKWSDVPGHAKKLWNETPTDTKVKAGAATAGGIGAALLARKFLKKRAGVAKTDVEAAVKGATKQKTEITGQAGDRMDPNDSAARYGGGLGNFEGKVAPKFTDKVNPTDMPKAFGKKASHDHFLGGFLDELVRVQTR